MQHANEVSITPVDRSHPYQVTVPGGQARLLVMDRKEGFPTSFALMATDVGHKVAIRISGGCKNMDDADKLAMLELFRHAFRGFRGFIWSGSTRQTTKEGLLDPMVTDIPGVVAMENPGCVALGSAPRTDVLRLVGESRLVLDDYGTAPNPTMSGILLVQNGADGKSQWDGDLEAAYGLMENLLTNAGFTAAGVIAWNGGPITADEIMISAEKGWPTILVRGSGRATDEIAEKLQSSDAELLGKLPKNHKMVIVQRENPETLRDALFRFGFLQSN